METFGPTPRAWKGPPRHPKTAKAQAPARSGPTEAYSSHPLRLQPSESRACPIRPGLCPLQQVSRASVPLAHCHLAGAAHACLGEFLRTHFRWTSWSCTCRVSLATQTEGRTAINAINPYPGPPRAKRRCHHLSKQKAPCVCCSERYLSLCKRPGIRASNYARDALSGPLTAAVARAN